MSSKSNLITNSDALPVVMNNVAASGGRMRMITGTVSVADSEFDADTDIIRLCKIPANAVIHNIIISMEDMDASTQSVADLGLWEAGDARRPPLPLHKVRKGYPMRGTYCEKHAAIHRQYEMLEQQILAEEHGLSFSAYIPSAKSLNPVNLVTSSPLTTLKQADIQSLSAMGWVIKPPSNGMETKEEELFRLIIESNGINERVKTLLTEGANVVNVETGGE